MAAGMLPGCQTQKTRQPDTQEVEPPETQEAEPPSGISLVPLTREIIELVKETGADINDFQYYISTTIELENERSRKSIEVDKDGSVIIRNISIPQRIKINKETKGKYVIAIPNTNDPTVLEICFDEENEKNTLFFRVNPNGTYFELLCTGKPLTTKYGKETYNLSIQRDTYDDPSPPQLFIKFGEIEFTRPNIQIVAGNGIKK
jgi:hypothetical protein